MIGYYYMIQKKSGRSIQFGAVGYIITFCLSKSYGKSWGPSKFWGGPDPPPRPPVVALMPIINLYSCIILLVGHVDYLNHYWSS